MLWESSNVNTPQALILAEHGKIRIAILRLAGVYDDIRHSPPLANQMQRIFERQLASHLYSCETSHRQSFLHPDDLIDAIMLVVERLTSAGWYRKHGLELPASMLAVHDTDEAETPEPAMADAHAGHDPSDAGQETQPVRMAAGLPYKMAGTPAADATEPATVYSCPMHPEIRQSSLGNCPRCGMTLEPGA